MDNVPQTDEPKKPELTDEYAQSLLRSVSMEHEQKYAEKPKIKHFISTRTLVILILSLVLSIVLGVWVTHVAGSKTDKSQDIINSAKNFNNPDAY